MTRLRHAGKAREAGSAPGRKPGGAVQRVYQAGARRQTRGETGRWTVGRVLKTLLIFAVSAVVALQLFFLICVVALNWINPPTTAFMIQQWVALRDTRPEPVIRQQWISYPKIAPTIKRAVIASEDANFADHDGVDWDAIEKAYDANQKRGKPMRGGSTITMQLAKNLFLSGERSYVRKAQELVITYMLEVCLSKQRIFEIYLNVAEWGVGVFGIEAASRHYYGISASQLNAEQGARLASMLPRPRFYDRNRGSVALMRKTAIVLRRMPSAELP